MNERLGLAKEILKDDGMIFVSIDDSQQAYLKILMDEIFGANNFVTTFSWQKKNNNGGSDKSRIDVQVEYIHMYAKNKNQVKFTSQPIDERKYTEEDEHIDSRGKYYLTELDRVSSKSSFQYTESLDYRISAPDGTRFKNYNNIKKPQSYRYTLSKELFDWMNGKNFITILQKTDKENGEKYWKAYRKSYHKVTVNRSKPYQIVPRVRGLNWTNQIINSTMTSTSGVQMLKNILNHKEFSFPKPVNLITHLINMHPNKNARVLDFFAGSGTTGHAVLELNRQDGGNRSFTLVTNDENNIGKDIAYERLFRINKGEGTKGETFDWAKKNKPYQSNLNVYDINYYDNYLNSYNADVDKYVESLKILLNNFNITKANIDHIDRTIIIKALSALLPQKKCLKQEECLK